MVRRRSCLTDRCWRLLRRGARWCAARGVWTGPAMQCCSPTAACAVRQTADGWLMENPSELCDSMCMVMSTSTLHNHCRSTCPLLHTVSPQTLLKTPQVVTTPFATSFDQLRAADEVNYKFERALQALGPQAATLPLFGVGHSMGALLYTIISARYPVQVSSRVLYCCCC